MILVELETASLEEHQAEQGRLFTHGRDIELGESSCDRPSSSLGGSALVSESASGVASRGSVVHLYELTRGYRGVLPTKRRGARERCEGNKEEGNSGCDLNHVDDDALESRGVE